MVLLLLYTVEVNTCSTHSRFLVPNYKPKIASGYRDMIIMMLPLHIHFSDENTKKSFEVSPVDKRTQGIECPEEFHRCHFLVSVFFFFFLRVLWALSKHINLQDVMSTLNYGENFSCLCLFTYECVCILCLYLNFWKKSS